MDKLSPIWITICSWNETILLQSVFRRIKLISILNPKSNHRWSLFRLTQNALNCNSYKWFPISTFCCTASQRVSCRRHGIACSVSGETCLPSYVSLPKYKLKNREFRVLIFMDLGAELELSTTTTCTSTIMYWDFFFFF
jgi:hypothetical protein